MLCVMDSSRGSIELQVFSTTKISKESALIKAGTPSNLGHFSSEHKLGC